MSASGHRLPPATEIPSPEIQFNAVLEALPDACMMLNLQGSITLCNTRAEALFGYSPGELIGKPAEALLSGRSPNGHTGAGRRKNFSSLSQEAGKKTSEVA